MRNNVKVIIMGLVVLITVLVSCTPAVASDWNTFLMDNSNSGITPDDAPVTTPENSVSWATQVGYVNTAPLIVNDIIYVASRENLSAVNKITGDVIWQSSMHNIDIIGNPAYGNNIIFVPTSGTGQVFAFDANTGEELWNLSLSSTKYLISPIKYEDSKIYFGGCNNWGGDNGIFYCYDENGNELWRHTPSDDSGYYYTGAALIGDYVVFGNSKENIASFYKSNGAPVNQINVTSLWGDYTPDLMRSSITYSEENERLYFTSKSGYCFALGFNPVTGNFKEADKARALIGVTTSTPVICNNRVYVGSGKVLDPSAGSGSLFCLNGTDLSEIWKFTPGEDATFQASPAISTRYLDVDGSIYIYITSNTIDGSLYCLRDFEGNTNPILRYRYAPSDTTKEFALGGPAISDGRVYYGNCKSTTGGYLFGLATEESLDSDTEDWNPWNDIESKGIPDGSFTTLPEVISAYNCFRNGTPAPETGASISISMVIEMYNSFRHTTSM